MVGFGGIAAMAVPKSAQVAIAVPAAIAVPLQFVRLILGLG